MFLPQGARDDTNSIVQIIHHPLGKLPATERGFQDWTMQSFSGKRGIRKEHVEKALWNVASNSSRPDRLSIYVCACSCVCVHAGVCVRMSGSSVCGILHARILEWTATPSSGGSCRPRNGTQVSRITGRFFTIGATREPQEYWRRVAYPFSRGSLRSSNRTGVSCIADRFFTS